MKKRKDYKLKLRSDKLKGKIQCPECERRFHTAIARSQHGVKMHGWK